MADKSLSPRRPREPGAPAGPEIATEHGRAESERKNYAGSSRASLFGLFRRQANPQTSQIPQSLRSGAGDSYLGAFDNISVGTAVTALESPQQAHETSEKAGKILEMASRYRQSLDSMSAAAAEFGNALYEYADTKGAASGRTQIPDNSVNTDLQAAGGLHLLISNHANILASSVTAKVEDPIKFEFENYKKRISIKEQEFKVSLRRRMAALRVADAQRQKDARKKHDLGTYRNSLLDLTYQIDDINRLKVEFLGDIHTLSTELAENVHSATASLVTAEIEVFESIARKGWSGGGLDGLLAGCPDPFESIPRHGISSTEIANLSMGRDESHVGRTNPSVEHQNHSRPRLSTQKSQQVNNSFNFDKSDKYHTQGISLIRSPNLFSVIQRGQILPPEESIREDDEDVDDGDDDDADEDGIDCDGNDDGKPGSGVTGSGREKLTNQAHKSNKNAKKDKPICKTVAITPKHSPVLLGHERGSSDISEIADLSLSQVPSREDETGSE